MSAYPQSMRRESAYNCTLNIESSKLIRNRCKETTLKFDMGIRIDLTFIKRKSCVKTF